VTALTGTVVGAAGAVGSSMVKKSANETPMATTNKTPLMIQLSRGLLSKAILLG
jgi:hypothetical protein